MEEVKVYTLKATGSKEKIKREKSLSTLANERHYWKTKEEAARQMRKEVEEKILKLLPPSSKGTQHIEIKDGIISVNKRRATKWKGNPEPVMQKYPEAFRIKYEPRISVLDKILRTHDPETAQLRAYIEEHLEIRESYSFRFEGSGEHDDTGEE